MNPVKVENLEFVFDAVIHASKYDEWTHYTKVLNKPPASQKAVDVVAVETTDPPEIAWLIEAKDFRIINSMTPPRSSNVEGLPQTVATKVFHTRAGLAHASKYASDKTELDTAIRAIKAREFRIVLHLEPYSATHSSLFPGEFAADVLVKLRTLVKGIDPNPLVLNIANTPAVGVPWTVS